MGAQARKVLFRVRGVEEVDEVRSKCGPGLFEGFGPAVPPACGRPPAWQPLPAWRPRASCAQPPRLRGSLSSTWARLQEFQDLIEAVRLSNLVKRPWHNLFKRRYRRAPLSAGPLGSVPAAVLHTLGLLGPCQLVTCCAPSGNTLLGRALPVLAARCAHPAGCCCRAAHASDPCKVRPLNAAAPTCRPQLVVSCVMMMFQQFTGINAVRALPSRLPLHVL